LAGDDASAARYTPQRLPRTACASAGERGRGGAGRLPNLGDPVARRVARILARVVPHSEACSGPTARVVDDQSPIRPSQTPPGTGSSTAVSGGAPSPFAPFLLAVVLAEVQSRQKSNHTESRSTCMHQPVTKRRKSATDSLYVAARGLSSRALKHHLLALNGDMPQGTHCALKRPGGNPAPGSSRDVTRRPGFPRRTPLRPPNKKHPLPS
jgi:hypothetical protein